MPLHAPVMLQERVGAPDQPGGQEPATPLLPAAVAIQTPSLAELIGHMICVQAF